MFASVFLSPIVLKLRRMQKKLYFNSSKEPDWNRFFTLTPDFLEDFQETKHLVETNAACLRSTRNFQARDSQSL